jgi:hypothetical protein
MKLYTEEQVKQIQQAILCNHKDAIMDTNYCLSVTTPIQLPCDEEIEEVASDYRSNSKFCDIETFEDGAKFAIKWMRNKIQGGNK